MARQGWAREMQGGDDGDIAKATEMSGAGAASRLRACGVGVIIAGGGESARVKGPKTRPAGGEYGVGLTR